MAVRSFLLSGPEPKKLLRPTKQMCQEDWRRTGEGGQDLVGQHAFVLHLLGAASVIPSWVFGHMEAEQGGQWSKPVLPSNPPVQITFSILAIPGCKLRQLIKDGGPGIWLGSAKLPKQIAAESATPHFVQVQIDEFLCHNLQTGPKPARVSGRSPSAGVGPGGGTT